MYPLATHLRRRSFFSSLNGIVVETPSNLAKCPVPSTSGHDSSIWAFGITPSTCVDEPDACDRHGRKMTAERLNRALSQGEW